MKLNKTVERYTELQPIDTGWIGTCPRCCHKGFVISKTRNVYECFGCNSTGDLKTFKTWVHGFQ